MSTSATPGASFNDTLDIRDNRTGKSYSVPIKDDSIRAADLKQIKVNVDDFGMMAYDPAFMNTASCRSAVTYLDGDQGILRYRGYPIGEEAGAYLRRRLMPVSFTEPRPVVPCFELEEGLAQFLDGVE